MSDEAHRELPVSRRDVICGGGASVFSAMIAARLGGTRAARAVAVRVGTDGYQFAVAPSKTADGVEIQHFGWGIGADKPLGRTLISEFGLSMHVESHRGAETRAIARASRT